MKSAFLIILLAPSILAAQTAVKIYTASVAGVTPPAFLPSQIPKMHDYERCKSQGTATFSLIIDSTGEPKNIYFLNPLGDPIDLLALKLVTEDRFKPGLLNGTPIAIAASLEVWVVGCIRKETDADGKMMVARLLDPDSQQRLKPPVDPPQQVVLASGSGLTAASSGPEPVVYTVGGEVIPPRQFPPSSFQLVIARRIPDLGSYKVSVLVDRYGLPASLKILATTDPDREKTIKDIVRLLRFRPAMLNGQPVPARVEFALASVETKKDR
jgi:hypothetical protein